MVPCEPLFVRAVGFELEIAGEVAAGFRGFGLRVEVVVV